jgi:hypothetical protein
MKTGSTGLFTTLVLSTGSVSNHSFMAKTETNPKFMVKMRKIIPKSRKCPEIINFTFFIPFIEGSILGSQISVAWK